MLKENLLRQGVDLAFETNLLYLDVNNNRVGVKTSIPNAELDINGIAIFNNSLKIDGSNLIALGTNANLYLTPNGLGQIVTTSNMSLANISLSGNADVSNLNSSNYVNASVLQSNIATGTAPIIATSTTRIANLNVAVAGNLINGNSNVVVDANSNVHMSVAGTSNVFTVTSTGANITGNLNITVNANVSNLTVTSNANVGNLSASSAITASSTVTGGNLSTAGTLTVTGSSYLGNLSVDNISISSTKTNANINLVPNGVGIIKIDASSALRIPVGTSSDRPLVSSAGMLRFSTGTSKLEFHDGTGWITIQSTTTSVTTDTFTGDGSTLNFTLSQSATTASVIVSINGTGQKPFTAYTVSGTTLTFTEAPSLTDVIEARTIATQTYVSDISDGTTQLLVNNSSPYIRGNVQGVTRIEIDSKNLNLGNIGIVANITGQSVSTSPVNIDNWSPSSYTAAKYLVAVTNGTSRQFTELLVTANTTNAYISNIGSVNSGSALMTFTANVSSSNAALWGTGVGTGNTVKVSRQLLV